MVSEKELLKDIIAQAPVKSVWEFTYSWDKIQEVFKDCGILNFDNKTFSVIVDDNNKDYFIKIMEDYNLSDWIVHQFIKKNSGETIFESYDHMAFSMISPNFPNSEILLAKYSGTDLLELMQEPPSV